MKLIPRFKTGGIYTSHSGKKHYKVIRRFDNSVSIVKVDEKDGDEIGPIEQLPIRVQQNLFRTDLGSPYEYTLLPKAFIKATNKVK